MRINTRNAALPLLVLLVIMLTAGACFPSYKDSSGKNSLKLGFPNCPVAVFVEKQYLGLEGDYHVYARLQPAKLLLLKANDVRVSLGGYKPGKIRLWDISANEPFNSAHPSRTPAIDPSHTDTLQAGKVYALVYTFYGRHRRHLRLEASVSIEGEQLGGTMLFKKHTQVSLFH